jgi:mono/diheme cytochrome c family protein
VNPQPESKKRTLILFALGLIFLAAVAAILYSLTAWNAPAAARQLENPVPATAAAIAAGKVIYHKHCESCHGVGGDGTGDRAPELSIMPTDFTDAHLMRRLSDGELFWKIAHGHRPMPGFASKLSETERWQVVDYIRTFAKESTNGLASVKAPSVESPALAARRPAVPSRSSR